MEISYTLANENDLSGIKQIMLEALSEDPTAFSVYRDEYETNGDWWWRGYIDVYLDPSRGRMYVAKDNDKVVGIVGVLYDSKRRKSHIANIVWFYVSKLNRNSGLGRQLITKLEAEITSRGDIKKMTLLVNQPQLAAIKIYESFGFHKNGIFEKELFIDGKYYDVVIMEKMI